MNKFKSILMGCAAMLAFSACSSDEPAQSPGTQPDDSKSTLYLDVNIKSNSPGSRATSDGWQSGTEHEVKDAGFYFFDKDGYYVTEAHVWQGGKEDASNDNVEFFGNQKLEVKGLNKDNLPKYLLTVLNIPNDFTPKRTIEETVAQEVNYKVTKDGKTYYVMTTSSFGPTDKQVSDKKYDRTRPYVNMLQDTDFKTDATTDEETVRVNIYVERLAVKFTLDYSKDIKDTMGEDGCPVISLKVDINDAVNTQPTETNLYIKLYGFGLTGTEKKSKISKDISGFLPATGGTNPWERWCDCDNYRSYWGKSVSYNKQIIIDDAKNFTLDYWYFKDVKTSFSTGAVYCLENTNTKDKIVSQKGILMPAKVTNLVIGAQVFKDSECNTPANDIVYYNDKYWERAEFRKYILSRLNDNGKLNFYKYSGSEETPDGTQKEHFIQVGEGDIHLVDADSISTGYTVVKCTKELKDTELWRMTVVDGKETFVKYTTQETPHKQLEANLATLVNNSIRANVLKEGIMFYNIPVEHLNDFVSNENRKKFMVENEGNYGVVRNHWYQITVNSISRLGQGIFEPSTGETNGEPIIPENPENEKYGVNATINVLSWKIVSQTEDL